MSRFFPILVIVVGLLPGCGEASLNNSPASADAAKQASSEMVRITGLQKAKGPTKNLATSASGMMNNGFNKR